ncbi:DUF429 domain-containing protein [Cellulomonas rhizosphaerae]|nr:DUF429 domain-containing protein [Cellulomonas rhizosphaerae]
MVRVLGVDACKAGWVGIELDGVAVRASFAPTIADLVAVVGRELDVVAIDIPIGLPDRSGRTADTLARRGLGRRGSTIFMTPVRSAVVEEDYDAANRAARAATGAGISRQAHGLRVKILDVDAYRAVAPVRLVEVHPELSFTRMTGQVLPRKTSWAGAAARRTALAAEGVVLDDSLGLAGQMAAVDDVLDAAAAAWSARRVAAGLAESYPAQPEVFSDGWPAAIWV